MVVRSRCSFSSAVPRPPSSTLFPYTTLFRSCRPLQPCAALSLGHAPPRDRAAPPHQGRLRRQSAEDRRRDRKSTRLNSSHQIISYAVFCLKKKKNKLL